MLYVAGLTLLHSERSKLFAILAFLSAIGLEIKKKKKTEKSVFFHTGDSGD